MSESVVSNSLVPAPARAGEARPVSPDDPDRRSTAPAEQPDAPAQKNAEQPKTGWRDNWRQKLAHPGLLAVIVFLVGSAMAMLVSDRLPYGGGAGARQAGLPLAAGALAGLILVPLAMRRAPSWLAGVVAGGIGSWIVLIFATTLRGTDHPYLGLLGDSGRLTAMATRYSVTAASADVWIKGLPGEYPPLFPWVVGRLSALIDVPAWALVGRAEVWFTGAAIVLGFVLWLRLVKPWAAVAVTLAAFMIFAIPAKAYEAITLFAFIPWVLATFGNPPRGRLHWLPAGLVGAFIVLAYYGWLVLGGIGVVMVAVATLRRGTDRRDFILYLLKMGAVTTVLSSWFVVPLVVARFTLGGENVSDLYGSSSLLDQMLPFLDFNWIGILQLIGLVGLIWLRGRQWWAWPLLALVIGAYAYRAIGALYFVLTNHTLLAHYTRSVYMGVLMAAGVLTILHAVPLLVRRLSLTPPKNAAAMALAIVIGWAGFTLTMDWMPGLGGRYSGYTEQAYREPLPDGGYVADYPNPTPWFPVGPIEREVTRVRGAGDLPVALSIDERLWSYLPYHGYLGNDTATSSVSRPFERIAEIEKLSRTKDPAEFSRLAAATRFGEIDVFALKRESAESWTWTFAYGYGQKPAVVTFTPQQFAAADWEVVQLPQDVVLAVRKR